MRSKRNPNRGVRVLILEANRPHDHSPMNAAAYAFHHRARYWNTIKAMIDYPKNQSWPSVRVHESPAIRGAGSNDSSDERWILMTEKFQTPAVRGAGSNQGKIIRTSRVSFRFKPLSFGALVLTMDANPQLLVYILFQTPVVGGAGSNPITEINCQI